MAFYKLKLRKRLNLHQRFTHNIQVKLIGLKQIYCPYTTQGNICVTLITCYSVLNLHLDIVVLQKHAQQNALLKYKHYTKEQSFTNNAKRPLARGL